MSSVMFDRHMCPYLRRNCKHKKNTNACYIYNKQCKEPHIHCPMRENFKPKKINLRIPWLSTAALIALVITILAIIAYVTSTKYRNTPISESIESSYMGWTPSYGSEAIL